ncbi:MAG: TatD family hydrolase [Proteobacteria bacterium]|nr:TatD family hydrolase [Pseudomonadota bacterium]
MFSFFDFYTHFFKIVNNRHHVQQITFCNFHVFATKKRNEPANAVISVDAIAEIKNIKREKVIETVFENTCRLYGNLDI